MTGSGTGDLLDVVVENLPKTEAIDEESELPHLSVVGRPNVGKSSFMDALSVSNGILLPKWQVQPATRYTPGTINLATIL